MKDNNSIEKTNKTYRLKALVEILQEEFRENDYEINTIFVRNYIKKLDLQIKKGKKIYNEKVLNVLRAVVVEKIFLKTHGFGAVEEMFIIAGKNTAGLKGLVYYLAEKYNFGERKEFLSGVHWVFDIEKTTTFLNEYEKKPQTGRPLKIDINQEIEIDETRFD